MSTLPQSIVVIERRITALCGLGNITRFDVALSFRTDFYRLRNIYLQFCENVIRHYDYEGTVCRVPGSSVDKDFHE